MRINNKGFAISTMLYGLLIILVLTTSVILGTMSFTRKNSKEFSDEVKEKLEEKVIEEAGDNVDVRDFSLSSDRYFKPAGQYTVFVAQRYNPNNTEYIAAVNGSITAEIVVCSNNEVYASNDKLYIKVTKQGNNSVEFSTKL